MKKILFFALVASLFAWSCEEKPIEIKSLVKGERRVLAEELTGVRCSNCPDGAADLLAIQNQVGKDNFIIVSIHAAAGSLAQPYVDAPASSIDFRFPEATALYNFIGTAEGVPTASIDRSVHNGAIWLDRPWGGFVSGDLQEDYGLVMSLDNSYDPATRTVNASISMLPLNTLEGENRLTVLLLQDSIVDVQLVGSVRVANYVHRHVLRDVISSPTGDVIAEPLIGGEDAVVKNYSVVLPASFDEKHCSIVAYVHHGGNPDKKVLQAVEKEVLE